ncbi:MAG: Kelch repeat-containing protein [Bacteroidia bacterium]
MMKTFSIKILLISVLLMMSFTIPAQNIWTKRASVGGSKRERAVSFSIGSRGYIGLGQDTLNLMIGDFWEYDPGTNTWTQKANFGGVAWRDAVGFSIGNKGYVGTGMDNADAPSGTTHSDFWEYNPATNSWTLKAPYPGNFGAGVYYATGWGTSSKGYICCGKAGVAYYINELWEFDPALNSWTQKAYYPGGNRIGAVAFAIGDIGYFGTGSDEATFKNDFYKYDPATDTWTPISSFPGSERYSCSAFTLEGKGYIMFGTDGGYKDELWEYDPAVDFWFAKAPIPGGARRSSCSFAIGGKGYAGTGKGPTGTRRDFWQYSPSTTVGIDENSENIISSVYPNPLTDQSTVILSEELFNSNKDLFWELNTVDGKLVQREKIITANFSISKGNVSPGIYFLSIRSATAVLGNKK